ncbi:MAG: hypothetical protein GY803_25375 [Chloroflexi bacterium]|nr:hypothetical protein [Chloroflexota bacterium]
MILPEQDAKLFFDLMWQLQFYVKERLDMLPQVKSLEEYSALDAQSRLEVRKALWDSPKFIADYVEANPDNLSTEHLAIVTGWQNFVQGKFFIERMLKKYTVFILNDTVYGVLGMYDPLNEIIDKRALPMYAEAVLLPFKDAIIYDGMLSGYSVFFGGGVKGNLKATYNKAKRKGEIIVSFNTAVQQKQQARTQVKLKDWQPTLTQLAQEAKSLRAQAGSPPTWSPAFSLVKASLDFAETAVARPEDPDALWDKLGKINNILKRVEKGIFQS